MSDYIMRYDEDEDDGSLSDYLEKQRLEAEELAKLPLIPMYMETRGLSREEVEALQPSDCQYGAIIHADFAQFYFDKYSIEQLSMHCIQSRTPDSVGRWKRIFARGNASENENQ